MLLERKYFRQAMRDNEGQTPPSLALSQGHDVIAKIILAWGNANSNTADRGGQTHSPDPNSLPPPSSTDYNGREVSSDSKDSISMFADTDLSTEPSSRPHPPSPGPLKSQNPSKNTSAHSSTTQAILTFTTDRLLTISSLVCLFAFLFYILSSSSLDIFSFRKYPPGEELV